MATTTKKSPKAKTKTATKKTSASKVTKPAATKTAVKVSKVSRAKRLSKNVTIQTLRSWNIATLVLCVLLAAVAAFVMGNDSYQLTIGHLAKDDLARAGSTVLAPAMTAVYDIEIRWAVVGIMVLAAVLPLLHITKLQSRYAEYVRGTRMAPLRWVDLGVTLALMTEVVAILSGFSDLAALKMMGGLVLVSCLLGLIAERQNNVVSRPVWSAYYTSIFSGLLPWVAIVAYAATTVVSGATGSPWYVYALYGTSFVGFLLLAMNQRKQYNKTGAWADYLVVERNYLALGLFTKVAFAAILIVGLQSL